MDIDTAVSFQTVFMNQLRRLLMKTKDLALMEELNQNGHDLLMASIKERVISLEAVGYLHNALDLCNSFGWTVKFDKGEFIR